MKKELFTRTKALLSFWSVILFAAAMIFTVGTFAKPISAAAAQNSTVNLINGKIISASSGSDHNLIVTDEGKVYTFGYNIRGQLGDGTNNNKGIPTEITDKFFEAGLLDADKIVSGNAGGYHSIAISASGKVFTFGSNPSGQLGDKTNTNRSLPTNITENFTQAGLLGSDKIISSSAGSSHTISLSESGKVFTFGINDNGQLGIGSTANKNIPNDITEKFTEAGLLGSDKIISIGAGGYHSIALSASGKVFTFGRNDYGQLGDGKNIDESVPIDITNGFSAAGLLGTDKIVSVAGGNYHTLALSASGKVYSFGYNNRGQLGNAATSNKNTPNDITEKISDAGLAGTDKIISIKAGYYHSIALSANGKVYTFGSNLSGQLGNGTIIGESFPIDVTNKLIGLTGSDKIAFIAAGSSHSMAISSSDGIFTCGSNDYGQSGKGNFPVESLPSEVSVDDDILQMSAGNYHSIAISTSGKVYTFGKNDIGQLGDKTNINRNAPTNITARFIEAGLLNTDKIISASAGFDHTIALSANGKVYTFGKNDFGQLGNGTAGASTNKNAPNDITNKFTQAGLLAADKIVFVSAGESHSIAISANGRVYSFGYNNNGQLGDGLTVDKNAPIDITVKFTTLKGADKIISASAGLSHTIALSATGKVYTFGLNSNNQLGDGTAVAKSTPTDITSKFTTAGLSGTDRIVSVSAGNAHSLAISASGKVFAFGYGYYGQLGDGTNKNKDVPTDITSKFTGLTGDKIVSVDAGAYHSIATSANGKVFTFGKNDYSLLGNGSTTIKYEPTEITDKIFDAELLDTNRIVSSSAGFNHSIVLSTSGKLFSFGHDLYGQLGLEKFSYSLFTIITSLFNTQAKLTISSSSIHIIGTPYTLTTSGGSGKGAVSYEIISGGTGAGSISGSTLTTTKSGTIVIKAIKAADSDYKATTSAEFTLTVFKSDGSGDVSLEGWIYDETAKNPMSNSTTNGTENVTYEYKIKGATDDTYSTSKPTEAGTYIVRATFAATEHYSSCIAVGEFTISKANGSGTVTLNSWTFGDEASNPSPSSLTNEINNVTYEYKLKDAPDNTYSSTKPTEAGTYSVRATFAATKNYETYTVVTDFTINKANGTGTITLDGWTFGDTAKNPAPSSATNGINNVTYEYKVKDAPDSTYSSTKPTEAGTYTVRTTFAATQNYEAYITITEFTISKAKGTGEVIMNGWTVGDMPSNPTPSSTTNGISNVTYEYKAKGATDDTYSAIKPTDAGTYIVRATFATTKNYEAYTVITEFTISKANGTGTVTLDGWTVGEEANNPTPNSTTNGTENVTYEYKIQGSSDYTYSATKPTEAGTYTVRATFAETDNYYDCIAVADFTIKAENNGLSGGAIAGIATGGTIVVGLGGFATYWFSIKKKSFVDLISKFTKKI